MKKYQTWMIGEIGAIGVAIAATYMVSYQLYDLAHISGFWLTVISIIVFWNSSDLILKWYHRGLAIEDKFHNGGDDT